MVKLRLTRTGKKGAPHYRIIAISARTKREGRALEYLGYYNPRTNPSTTELNEERIKYWLEQGAQPTDTVKRMLIKANVIEAPKTQKVFNKKPGKKATERAELNAQKADAKKAEAKVEPTAETKE